MPEFRSVRAPSYDVDGLVTKLNEAASEGWDVVTVVPSSSDLVAILRKDGRAASAPKTAEPVVVAAVPKATEAPKPTGGTPPADDLDTKVSTFLGEDDVEKNAAAVVAAERVTEPVKPEPAGWGTAPASASQPSPAPASGPIPTPGSSPSPTGSPAPSPAGPSPAPAGPGLGASAAGATSMKPSTPAGWYPDPSGRYELRYWNGNDWSEHVARSGQQFTDPPVA